MSDNANKMGTSMESIQNAYQGFAKQNYTMLDNLKLGYGGTKEEMERLIEDANRVKEANGEMANLSIDSFADVTEAIHIIQTEMGITGTTATEASTTIEGSVNSMKSAWENLITDLGKGNADIGESVDELMDSVETALGNIIPAVQQILENITTAIPEIIPRVIEGLSSIITEVLPSLLEAGLQLLTALLQGISDNFDSIK
jgi:phage-related protein